MDSRKKKFLVVVVGPTAVGKTETCIQLAEYYNTEIVSADSRQFYREMNIGTAKPSETELSKAPHHLVGQLSIQDSYTAKDFEEDALRLIEEIHCRSDVAILSGGSGLYVKAVCEGMDEMPAVPASIRAALMTELREKGLDYLLSRLVTLDPDYYATVDRANPQRIVRALEVIQFTGQPFSSFRKKSKVSRPFQILKIGLMRERDALYDRINLRMDEMIRNGLFEEAEKLFPYRNRNALQTVGYSEIFGFMEGHYDYEEAVRLLKRNSRRYAKRQITWFKKDDEVVWFSPKQISEITDHINKAIAKMSRSH